ncbi:hypothetical protein MAPG_07948 [Magnaporthiopsis poae ATCC 64411]|uniref:SAM-dependent MTase RsmB/NOP-type domain-containing protein n=1 Tax=Magnaporthiopsis poae (strain ATCC 64411 / 73-15) TaxID=644358 RepID=A0A0C4E619_MAGP6|nr:hypothetical protein MAPG_07948 [Magnaporthiopsis poae ATCC 64411]
MSLYHEAAAVLASSEGGSLKARVFRLKTLKSAPAQVYALAFETCKWSPILKEVVENAQLLQHERKLTPVLALLLAHDLLLAKGGVALPASHGLRQSVERHKARLTAELTRARIRRRTPSLDALRAELDEVASPDAGHPRWVRINTLKTSLAAELESTFAGFTRVASVPNLLARSEPDGIYVDEHIPNLIAVPRRVEIIKKEAYKSGAIILQDKASCFPAYLLDPRPEDGEALDACAAPGNKTTHLAAVLESRRAASGSPELPVRIHAFEKDPVRAMTLEKMVRLAGSDGFTCLNKGKDFLKADPDDALYANVAALLLDPSCSGSGIVGRDDAPELRLPNAPRAKAAAKLELNSTKGRLDRKRKRGDDDQNTGNVGDGSGVGQTLVDDDGKTTVVSSEADLKARLAALSSFQCSLLVHALRFPAARRVTYSTCSVHAEENEHVVLAALRSEVARERGWRIALRNPEWEPTEQGGGDEGVAEGCIRAYKGDSHGVMGFFVAALVRDGGAVGSHSAGDATPTAASVSKAEIEDSEDSDWGGFDD